MDYFNCLTLSPNLRAQLVLVIPKWKLNRTLTTELFALHLQRHNIIF